MYRLLLLAVLGLGLAACATPYADSGLTGGFEVKDLGQDVYRVKFAGNGYTSRETVQTYWLYRSAELAVEKGFSGFEILSDMSFVERDPANDHDAAAARNRSVAASTFARIAASPDELAAASAWRSGGREIVGAPGGRVRVALGGMVFIYGGGGAVSRPAIEGDVHLIRQPVESKPPKLFNAKTLQAALEPIVKAEKCSGGNVCPHVHEYLLPKGKLQ